MAGMHNYLPIRKTFGYLQVFVHENPKKATRTPDFTPPKQIQQGCDIIYLIFDIMSTALKHTYPLQQWKTVWTTFIEKKLGNPEIDCLCCIMIFEANRQLLHKWHSLYGFLPKWIFIQAQGEDAKAAVLLIKPYSKLWRLRLSTSINSWQ